jgi:hypothetical protein
MPATIDSLGTKLTSTSGAFSGVAAQPAKEKSIAMFIHLFMPTKDL